MKNKIKTNDFLPNVIVAGFPRCGTTYIYNILSQNPKIHIPKGKEINYFNKDHYYLSLPKEKNPNYDKSLRWYGSFFHTKKKVRVAFDILTALDMNSALRIKKTIPNCKIIICRRDEREHLKSIYKILKSNGDIRPNISFEKYRVKFPELREISKFDKRIKEYKRTFGKNLIIIEFEDIKKNPKKVINNIHKFLSLSDFDYNYDQPKNSGDSLKPSYWKYVKKRISLFLRKLKLNKIYHRLIRDKIHFKNE